MRLSLKLLLIAELVLFLAVLAILIPVRGQMRQQVVEDLQSQLRAVAVTAALQLDGDLHDRVRTATDASNPAFATLRDRLRAIRDANGLEPEHIYTFYRDGDAARFGVMTQTKPFVGDRYDLRPAIRAVFDTGQPQVSDLYTDSYGQWISAYAPVRNAAGAVVGVLEVDRPAAAYFARYEYVTQLVGVLGVTVLAVSSVLGWLAHNRIVLRPVRALREGLAALARRDFNHRIRLKTGDEFQELAESFNNVSQQLDIARMIQKNFFPREVPRQPGWRFAAKSVACDATGGDYFDAFNLGDGRTVILVADVSGHGLGPSLLMSACRSSLRALATSGLEPDAWLARLDALLADDLTDGRFITMVLGVVAADGTFTFANAGHGPALVATRGGGVVSLETHRLPLGIGFDGAPADPQTTLALVSGDRIFLATDGLTEAFDPAGAMPDRAAIEAIVGDRSLTCDEVLRKLDALLTDHCKGRPLSDDVTMLCVDRVPVADPADETVTTPAAPALA